MKKAIQGSALLGLMLAGAVHAQTGPSWNGGDLVVTATNTAHNALLVYNTNGDMVEQVRDRIPTNIRMHRSIRMVRSAPTPVGQTRAGNRVRVRVAADPHG